MLDKKEIEYRIVKNSNKFLLQVLNKGLFKDKWEYVCDYYSSLYSPKTIFNSEKDCDDYVQKRCMYNPVQTRFIKHPMIKSF